MPLIIVKIVTGHTVEQKRGLVKDITEAAIKNLKVAPEWVKVFIDEYCKENLAENGKLFVDR